MNQGLAKGAIIVIVASLISVATAGYLSWQFIFQPIVLPEQISEEITETEPAAENLKVLSSASVIDYWVNRQNGDIYYLSADGVYKITAGGQEEKLSSQTAQLNEPIKPSTDGAKAIASLAIFDTDTKEFQPLPAGAVSAAWDPLSNNRLIYLKSFGAVSSINLFTLSNKKSQEIIKLNQKDLQLEWILPTVVYLKEKPSAESLSSIWALDINRKTLTTVVKEEQGLTVRWTPDGNSGLKFTGNGINNSMKIIDNKNRTLANLNLLALPGKCTLSAFNAYCAIPNNLPPSAKLPDDYLKRKIFTTDDINLINLASGRSEQVFSGEQQTLDINRPLFYKDRLLFINRYNNKLYSLEL